jgi:hypothetical protein
VVALFVGNQRLAAAPAYLLLGTVKPFAGPDGALMRGSPVFGCGVCAWLRDCGFESPCENELVVGDAPTDASRFPAP